MRQTEHSKGLVAVFVIGIFVIPIGLYTGQIALLSVYIILQSVVFAFHTHEVPGEYKNVTSDSVKPNVPKKDKQELISESMEINQEYREFFTEEEKDYVDRLFTRYMSKEEYQTAMDLKSYLLFLMSKYY